MNRQTLQQMIRIWARQGLFSGDLNRVQQYCLAWMISEEQETSFNTTKLGILAANPEIYKAVFEKPSFELNDDAPWITPQDEDTADEVLAQITAWQNAKETL